MARRPLLAAHCPDRGILHSAVLGYLLFHTSGAMLPQMILSFSWGVVVSGIIYVNLGGYLVKSLGSSLASREQESS